MIYELFFLFTVQILVGVFVPALVIMGILLVVIYLRKRTVPPQTNTEPISGLSNVAAVRNHDDTLYPPPYEEIELRSSVVSNTEYAEITDLTDRQRNDKTYENFEPKPQDDHNQYEALRSLTDASATDNDHLYARAQPRY